MDHAQFVRYRARLLRIANQVSDRKVKDYAHSTVDRLANFKRNGARLGAAPEFVLGVYMNKHQDAIDRVITDVQAGQRIQDIEGDVSEPIEGRIIDALNYLILLGALLAERRAAEVAAGAGQ